MLIAGFNLRITREWITWQSTNRKLGFGNRLKYIFSLECASITIKSVFHEKFENNRKYSLKLEVTRRWEWCRTTINNHVESLIVQTLSEGQQLNETCKTANIEIFLLDWGVETFDKQNVVAGVAHRGLLKKVTRLELNVQAVEFSTEIWRKAKFRNVLMRLRRVRWSRVIPKCLERYCCCWRRRCLLSLSFIFEFSHSIVKPC